MEKICISTWYKSNNYGTGLQAIALLIFLKNRGYNCCFLEDRRPNMIKQKSKKQKMKSMIEAVLKGKVVAKFLYYNHFKEKNIFQAEYMKKTNPVITIRCEEDIVSLNQSIDTFIIGGDQVLNPFYLEDKHLLTFVDDEKKMFTYGSSVGVKEIPEELKWKYSKYLERLKCISVREKMSAEALDFLALPVEVVLDPTMLLSEKEWDTFIADAKIEETVKNEQYILCYFVGDRHSYWSYVKKIKKKTGFNVIVIPLNYASCMNAYYKHYKTSPKEFLWLIKNASIVCTDSFHATIFAILFKKEFYTLKRFLDNSVSSQNGRVWNLLERYNLTERFIEDESTFIRREIVGYENIMCKLDCEREESTKWLEKALKE